ncbi:hypothetical protein CPAR01_03427 [Colletotrichum paranaense]|uniref:Uncharacterized protein n=1 Tax=Colletotrichum paranaense TaxID=1914294 RepID=A0ABQ9T2D6_9PEZI|nr:uncharacterized protein CPAR01_03427 [Colletotrichum paranaense]KAK1545925.1 hypothetical protein CPAR01_03427 [Colletotrichum paranaense]
MAEVNPDQPTAEILFKVIAERRLATDPQTLKDFFFDRCITTKGQEKLHAFDYNQYICNPNDVDAELAAHAEEIMGALAGPVDDDGYMARIPVFMWGQARLRHKKEALEAKGEYVRTVHGTRFSSVPNVEPGGPPAAGHAIFCPDGFNGVPLSEITRAMQNIPGVTPQDLPAMQIWFFTRCKSHDQAFNLLRIYQTLLIDLDFTPREIEDWLAQGHLGRNIVMHFENNLGEIPEYLMMWLMAHIWIFGLEPGAALQEDVPVFKFSVEDKEFLGQSLARVRAVTEPKGFLEMWLLGPEEEEEEEYPLTCERRLEPDNWKKLYSSWEWRQKIADMWYRSPRKDWMKK